MIELNWRQCGRDQHWCDFFHVDLPNSWFNSSQGVYIIWHGGEPREVIYIGKGNIGARLLAHRKDPQITAYREKGPLYVTWAVADRGDLDGIARYLIETIRPIMSGEIREVDPIEASPPSRWMRAKSSDEGS